MAPRDILADLPPRQRPKNEIADLWDALQSYANRTGEHFMGGLEQNAQGFGDIYERGAVHTGIPRMAFGGLASLGAPVSAALEPILSPYLAPAMQKMNEYVGKPIEAATGYPADLANEIALLPLGLLGKVAKHAVPRLASMGDAIGDAFGPDMPLAGAVRNTFGGPKAKNFPHDKAHIAEIMEKKGIAAEDIHDQTGLHRGTDGAWRFEIDDSRSYYTPPAPDEMLRTSKGLDYLPVDNIIGHKELFDNYPDIAKMLVYYAPKEKIGGAGVYSGKSDFIALSDHLSEKGGLETILHEIQHAIQQREGFARGGSIKDPEYRNLAGEVEARNTQKRKGLSAEKRAKSFPLFTEDVPRSKQIINKGSGQLTHSPGPLSSAIRGSGPVPKGLTNDSPSVGSANAPGPNAGEAIAATNSAFRVHPTDSQVAGNMKPGAASNSGIEKLDRVLGDLGLEISRIENSQSISNQFGPSLSKYFYVTPPNGREIKVRVSDHDYLPPSDGVADVRYWDSPEEISAALHKALGREVPKDIEKSVSSQRAEYALAKKAEKEAKIFDYKSEHEPKIAKALSDVVGLKGRDRVMPLWDLVGSNRPGAKAARITLRNWGVSDDTLSALINIKNERFSDL